MGKGKIVVLVVAVGALIGGLVWWATGRQAKVPVGRAPLPANNGGGGGGGFDFTGAAKGLVSAIGGLAGRSTGGSGSSGGMVDASGGLADSGVNIPYSSTDTSNPNSGSDYFSQLDNGDGGMVASGIGQSLSEGASE